MNIRREIYADNKTTYVLQTDTAAGLARRYTVLAFNGHTKSTHVVGREVTLGLARRLCHGQRIA